MKYLKYPKKQQNINKLVSSTKLNINQFIYCICLGEQTIVLRSDYMQVTKQSWNTNYMWIAYPWRRNELPAPHIVYNPSMKSVGESGVSTGFHRSWVGVVQVLDWSNSLKSFPWTGIRGLNGSCVTEGLIR